MRCLLKWKSIYNSILIKKYINKLVHIINKWLMNQYTQLKPMINQKIFIIKSNNSYKHIVSNKVCAMKVFRAQKILLQRCSSASQAIGPLTKQEWSWITEIKRALSLHRWPMLSPSDLWIALYSIPENVYYGETHQAGLECDVITYRSVGWSCSRAFWSFTLHVPILINVSVMSFLLKKILLHSGFTL